MVADRDAFRARAVLRDNGVDGLTRGMSFAPTELTCDAFLDGRLRLWQPRRGYRAATDPVLLAAFVPARPGERVLELGCGAGTAALCLAARVAGLELHGLELQPAYAELARRNAAENGLRARRCTRATCAARRPRCGALVFDHVLANPPFHPAARHRRRRPRPRPRPPRGRGGARRLDRRRPPAARARRAAGADPPHRRGWPRSSRRSPAAPARSRSCRSPRAPGGRPRACWCGPARAAARR